MIENQTVTKQELLQKVRDGMFSTKKSMTVKSSMMMRSQEIKRHKIEYRFRLRITVGQDKYIA